MTEERAALAPGAPEAESLDWRGTSRFEVIRRIGRGGMGAVYEARDAERRERVALKTLLQFDPAGLFLFKQEFRALADVQHRNLVRLHEFVATEGDDAGAGKVVSSPTTEGRPSGH
jgi:serine/threonine protein kinase